MPISTITKTEARKIKKADLINHCFQLQEFIGKFDFTELIKENKELKKDRNVFEEQLHKTLECQAEEEEKYEKEIKKLKKENEKILQQLEDYKYLYKTLWFGQETFEGFDTSKVLHLQNKYRNPEWEKELYSL